MNATTVSERWFAETGTPYYVTFGHAAALEHGDKPAVDRCRCGAERMTDDPTIPACGQPYHCPALLADRDREQAEVARKANADKFYEGNVRLAFGIRCF